MVEIKEKYDLMLYNTATGIQLIMKYTALVLIRWCAGKMLRQALTHWKFS